MTPAPAPTLETRLAPVMFGLGFVYLLVVAGLIHRATEPQVTAGELAVMEYALLGLWPVFLVEPAVGFLRRGPGVSARTALARVLLVWVAPPARIAWVHPRTNAIWLPRIGWQPPGKPLLKALDRVFGGPMLVFAFLILPVLAMEHLPPEHVQQVPGYALALHVSVAAIWVAFALELILKASAAPRTLVYFKERWLDAAIVLLPTLEFVLTRWVEATPLLRLLRLSRALGPQQLGAMNRAYRLRGLMMKGWHAFLILEGVGRLVGITPEKRLRQVEAQIADLEEQLAELRAVSDELRKKLTVSREAQPRAEAPSG